MKTNINEVISCLWFLGERFFVTPTHSTKQKHVCEAPYSAGVWISLTHTHARARALPPSHVKLTDSGSAAAFTRPKRPSPHAAVDLLAHTALREQGRPFSSRCSVSLSLWENWAKNLPPRIPLLFFPRRGRALPFLGSTWVFLVS